MTYNYGFYSHDALTPLFGILSGINDILRVPSVLLSVATYVLTALALYTIAQRRGIHKPWLAWIPVVNCWLLGSLSDQYQYVVGGVNKSKRKILLGLSIARLVIAISIGVTAVVMVVRAVLSIPGNPSEELLLQAIIEPLFSVLGLCIPLLGVTLAYVIIRYIALYDLYKSLDPNNCVLFLVLSILFGVTEPFFLFFNREKDLGMPPRRQPAAAGAQEPWQDENKDYL